MNVDVLCVGQAVYDLVFTVDHHPAADEKCFASGLYEGGGGPASNAALTVARLGGAAAFAGYLGNDRYGDLHLEELRSGGVLTGLIARGAHPTPLSAIIVKPGGERTVVTHKGSTPVLEPGQVDFTSVRPRAVLFDGHEPAISLPLAKHCRDLGIITVLDAGSVHRGTNELAPICTHLIAAEKFAKNYCRADNAEEAVRMLAGTAPVAVVTLGSRGLVWARGDEWGRVPAFEANAVDTTGAGDIFHGAFALRTAQGDDLTAALRYAAAAAALGCAVLGARAGIPSKARVDEFLLRRPV